jgi:ethanolamine utilization microcompartment shell protein EutL
VPDFQLRSYVLIDCMQPQYAAYVGATVQGDIPVAGMAELYIEVAPSNEVYRIADAALKAADVRPATQYIEREFGLLEVHSFDPSAVQAAAEAVFSLTGLSANDAMAPEVASAQVITNVDPYQAQLINKFRRGALLVPGQTLLVMEVAPAAYVTLAANEAEKSADIDQVFISNVGRFGRLMVAGSESEVLAARDGALDAIQSLGRARAAP